MYGGTTLKPLRPGECFIDEGWHMSLSFEPGPAVSTPYSVSYFTTPDPAKYLPAGPPTERYRALVQRADDLRRLIPDFDLRHQA